MASATATLVLKAKEVSNKCDNQNDRNAVIGSATQCALAASQLVACTKVVAPTFSNPECQEQLVEAAKQVAKSVENVVETSQVSTLNFSFTYHVVFLRRWVVCCIVDVVN